MNNIHALWDNLFPLNEVDRDCFKECKQRLGQDSNILWYPSSGGDFRDLIQTHPGLWGNADGADRLALPGLFIHTDYHPYELNATLPRSCFQQRPPPRPREEQGRLGLDNEPSFIDPVPPPPPPHHPIPIHDDGRTCITATRLVPLVLNSEIGLHNFTTRGRPSEQNWLGGKAALMELAIHSHKLGSFARQLLYLFCENCNFFNEFVLRRGLKPSHLVHIRDGVGYGGGWGVSMDFLHRYLGFMDVKYLITDCSFPTGTNRFLTLCRRARRVLHSPGNPPTDRAELCTLSWGDNCMSAAVYRVRREPPVLWGRTRRRAGRIRGAGRERRLAAIGGYTSPAGARTL